MDIKLNEKKCTVDEKTKAYALKKVAKLEKYFRGDATAAVTFRVHKKDCRAELTVQTGSFYFRADETTSDMMASIDSVVDSIEGQIRRNKTRLAKRIRTDAFTRTAVETTEPVAPDANVDEVEEETTLEVVRSKKFTIKPMNVEEAILQMNLLGHNFFVFRDDDADGAFSVVYKRKDGGYGLIEDEG